MIKHTFRRLLRLPVPALGVLLFAAILAITLCGLQRSNEAELVKYEETYHAIPVDFAVTNLSGTKSTNLNIPYLFVEAFETGLKRFVTDFQSASDHAIVGRYSSNMLFGITSIAMAPELWPENGCEIQWSEGYDESIFGGKDLVCLVPEDTEVSEDEETGEVYVELDFEYAPLDPENPVKYSCRLQVVGTYQGASIYCPFTICRRVYGALGETFSVNALRATLSNNDDLEVLRTASKKWFAEPNPLGEKTPCDHIPYQYYPFALDIQDDLLQRTAETLQKSIQTNQICGVLILCLSAAAGLLIGFLMVRSRKREIALMRTMGTPDGSIFFGFVLEQALCFGLGIALGGAYNAWQPANQLGILAGVFFAGLTLALLICLRNNLMTTIKEEE